MPKIEAVIFDVDGTLVDTSEYIIQAYEHTLKHHGLPKRTREEIASQIGRKLEDCYAFLAPGAEERALIDIHRAFQNENLALVKPFDSCNDVLEILATERKLAIFTSRKNILPSLEVAGIDTSLFAEVIDANMFEKGKPDPEGIHLILGRISLDPAQVVMVGDAGVDILAGKNAQVAATIGLTHGFGTRPELEIAGADYILDSLDTLPPLLKTIEQQLRPI